MNIQRHTQPHMLEKYSFYWSEVRLIIAACALFLGGVPPIYFIFSHTPGFFGLITSLLKLCWIISGLASFYLLYRWAKNGMKLFGSAHISSRQHDTFAFLVSVISGLNLGIVGLLGTNIGMNISSNRFIFIVVGLLYIWSGQYLWKKWKRHGKHMV